ncbi:MAG: hypothetical protein ABIG44_00300 [Planctomycetota bacterium]
MKPSFRPDIWLIAALLVVSVVGGVVLNTQTCKELDEREWTYFGRMNIWRSTFDALSATCGVGLLLYDVDDEYTPTGRWVLTGLGIAGALLFLAAARGAIQRLWLACKESVPLPSLGLILVVFVLLTGLSIPVVACLEGFISGTDKWIGQGGWSSSAWRAIAAFASLGWLPGDTHRSSHWIYAVVALVGGLGWTIWLLPMSRLRRRCLYTPRVLGLALTYVIFLVLMAGILYTLEAPRGGSPSNASSEALTGDISGERMGRCLVQITCASCAGMATESLQEHNITEGSKMVLASTLLLGPQAGSVSGGIKWSLLIWALGGALAALAARGRSSHAASFRCLLSGIVCLALLILLTTIVAGGLLVIESRTASIYQSPPTFADAFLDAASAVGGGNLTTGLIERVTSRNLSSGIRQSVDLYQYGMMWLMAAMLLGRVLPIFVLCHMAGAKIHDTRRGAPPLI